MWYMFLQVLLTLVSVVFNPGWRAVDKALSSLQSAVEEEEKRATEMEHYISLLKNMKQGLHTRLTRSTSFTGSCSDIVSVETNGNAQELLSDVFSQSQPDSLGDVYFDLHEAVGREGETQSITIDASSEGQGQNSKEATTSENTHHPSTSIDSTPFPCDSSLLHSTFSLPTPTTSHPHYLPTLTSHPRSLTSHPHSLPNTHRPRLLLCGAKGCGQSSYLGPALLHALEEFPVRVLDFPALFSAGSQSPEEASSQVGMGDRRGSLLCYYVVLLVQ